MASADRPAALVLLLAPSEKVGEARVVVASPNLRVRSVTLRRIRAGRTKRATYQPSSSSTKAASEPW